MQWLSDLPFAGNPVAQIGFLAACGIAALVALAIVYRLVFAHRLRVPGGRTRQPRLGLVDAFSLDGQRQLVLVRRDNVEHLVMIGGPNDVLLESQINRALAAPRENGLAASGPAAPSRRRTDAVAVAPSPASAPPSPASLEPHAPASLAPVAAELSPIPIRAVAKPAMQPPPAPIAPPGPAAAPAPAPSPATGVTEPALAVVAGAGGPAAAPSPAPARRTMPPPIAPLSRTNVARLPEKPPQPAPSTAAPAAPIAPQPVPPASSPHAAPTPHTVEATAPQPARPVGTEKADKTEKAERTAPQPAATDAPPHAKPSEVAPATPKPAPRDATVRISPVASSASHPASAAPFNAHQPAAPYEASGTVHVEPKMAPKIDARGLFAQAAPLNPAPVAPPSGAHPQPPRHEPPGQVLHGEPKGGAKLDGRGALSPAAPSYPSPVAPQPIGAIAQAPSPHATPVAPPQRSVSVPQPAPVAKSPPKTDDPFAGLDSLEAEMAKLLGREKLN